MRLIFQNSLFLLFAFLIASGAYGAPQPIEIDVVANPNLNKSQSLELTRSFQHFEPLYKELIWKNNDKWLLEKKQKLESALLAVDMPDMLQKAQIFFDANLPSKQDYIIALVPISTASNGCITYAHHIRVASPLSDAESQTCIESCPTPVPYFYFT